jgi:hypothetical protein
VVVFIEKQLKLIMEQLKYHNIKIKIENGFIKFQMFNKKDKFVTNLRYYHENNFNIRSEWHCTTEKVVNTLISDYHYVMSYRLDCQ